jgi:uncharacterized protein (DUF1800 family)
MKTLLVSSLVALAQALPAQQPALTARDSAFHALNRLGYGPRPGEVERVASLGVMTWIERQLSPERIADDRLARVERDFEILGYDRGDLAGMYAQARRERRREKLGDGADTVAAGRAVGPLEQRGRRLAGEFADLAVARAVVSERQLYEVMVDFWTNHFNVYVAKGADRFLAPDYIEHTIRPHAMGKFADLLIATAQSPAMLFYLDNWRSTAQGRNENYARELLELHTLGVDGGYTQRDVIEVARIFTGWGIQSPRRGAGFEFHARAHDAGEKQVLGVRFPSGHGMDEGIRLLKLLASHPATMHHVSRQLCQRFVSDDPPDGCVDDAVAAWKRTDGDVREVLRAIVRGADFWAAQNVRTKIKTPLEFVVSAARAVAAEPDTSPRLAQVVARLGEPLYRHVAPDGYPEREEAWVNSGALLDRMTAAVALAAGRLPGVTVSLDSVTVALDPGALIDAVDATILGGAMSANTRAVIKRQIADVSDPRQARALAVGLAIGGPEFQRQ